MTSALLCYFMEEGNVLIPKADVQMWLDPVTQKGFPGDSVVKILSANAGDIRDAGLNSGLEGSPGGGHGNPLQYSCLKNPHG